MVSVHTREQQLAKLRADRERELQSERAILAFAVENSVLPIGANRLFDRSGQYPGWHAIVTDLVRNLAAGEHSMLQQFVVVESALLARSEDGVLVREFEMLLDASDRSRLTCCVCGGRRGRQTISVSRMSCDICAAVDLMLRNDAEAAEARGWHSIF